MEQDVKKLDDDGADDYFSYTKKIIDKWSFLISKCPIKKDSCLDVQEPA
jgi:hypothetical protein